MKYVSLQTVSQILQIALSVDLQVIDFQIDSRLIQSGSLFFALPGERNDGHQFLAEVKQRGGIGAVVSLSYTGPDFGLALFKVPDVLEALYCLARHFLKQRTGKIVAVTGSVGKTTTKDFIKTLFQEKFSLQATLKSYNTKLTLPLTILNQREDAHVLVLEMGSSGPGHLQNLIDLAPPDVSLITKISLAHAAFFPKGLAQIAEEKGTIFSHPKTKHIIFPSCFLQFSQAIAALDPKKEKLSFSLDDPSADYFLKGEGGRGFIDERGVRALEFELPFQTTHNLENLAASIAAARVFDMSWEEIEKGMKGLKSPAMRFELLEKEGISFINDAYNASPASMEAALKNLPRPKAGGKTIAVLGEMRELGPFSYHAHLEVGKLAVQACDLLFSLGQEAKAFHPPFEEAKKGREHFETLEALIDALQRVMRPGDVVLVKGSRALEMEKIFSRVGH